MTEHQEPVHKRAALDIIVNLYQCLETSSATRYDKTPRTCVQTGSTRYYRKDLYQCLETSSATRYDKTPRTCVQTGTTRYYRQDWYQCLETKVQQHATHQHHALA